MSQSAGASGKSKRFPWGVASGVLAAVVLVGAGVWAMTGASQVVNGQLITYTVARTELPIVVTARGSLESQVETTILCQVEAVASSRSSQTGTQIIYIVPNGSAVKEGDVLVELDSAPIREQLDSQILNYNAAVSDQIQATARFENQKTQNETSEAEAELSLRLAKLELEMYDDKESGTYRLDMDARDRSVETAKNGVLEALANLSLQKTELNGIKQLFELGYRGKGDLDESNYAFLRAEDALATATNTLTTALAERQKLERFESEMQRMQLEGNVDSRVRALNQVLLDNDSLLKQAEAAKDAADQRLVKEKERLENYERQVANCVIRAPHDGMVVYARERNRNQDVEIVPGAFVRERQAILTLPDLTKMQVLTSIHESVLNKIVPGQNVSIRVDAFPNKVYRGMVGAVAVLPVAGGWSASDAKMYETVIKIDGEVEQLKPGMTSVAEIHVDRLQDVMTVPVQAIIERRGDRWCYVATPTGPERRDIVLGETNEKFVEIRSGVEPGDQVVLNPDAIPDASQSDKGIIDEPAYSNDEEMFAARPPQEDGPVATTARRGGPGRGFGGAGRGFGGPRGQGDGARGLGGFRGGQGNPGGGQSMPEVEPVATPIEALNETPAPVSSS